MSERAPPAGCSTSLGAAAMLALASPILAVAAVMIRAHRRRAGALSPAAPRARAPPVSDHQAADHDRRTRHAARRGVARPRSRRAASARQRAARRDGPGGPARADRRRRPASRLGRAVVRSALDVPPGITGPAQIAAVRRCHPRTTWRLDRRYVLAPQHPRRSRASWPRRCWCRCWASAARAGRRALREVGHEGPRHRRGQHRHHAGQPAARAPGRAGDQTTSWCRRCASRRRSTSPISPSCERRGARIVRATTAAANADLLASVDYVFDCRKDGAARRDRDRYLEIANLRGVSAQGSEDGFGVPFVGGVNPGAVPGRASSRSRRATRTRPRRCWRRWQARRSNTWRKPIWSVSAAARTWAAASAWSAPASSAGTATRRPAPTTPPTRRACSRRSGSRRS